jgi:exopolysaccharide biosynthesis polyprenyl glycosylphosphotransferase
MQVASQFDTPSAPLGPGLYLAIKRLIDVAVAAALLILLSVVLLVCAVAIRLDSPGPIFFRQRRVGERGRNFTMLKFRTMRVDADQATHREYATSFIRGQASRQGATGAEVFKLARDHRVTRVGRWLRRSSLDELPQLWNVLRGEMTLVGPRPPIPYEVEQYQPTHKQRLAVTPGITGLWQVRGRSNTTFEEMVALDLEYIRRRSLLLDLRILLATIPAVLSTRGVH